MNCNRIQREGNCDAAQWMECTYCGAIDNEPCRGVKKPEPWNDKEKHLADGIRKLEAGVSGDGPYPYELEAVIADLLKRVKSLEAHNDGGKQRREEL